MGEHGDIPANSQAYPPRKIDPEGKDAVSIAAELIDARTIDISKGFPANDAQQIDKILQELLLSDVSRMPIVATAEGVFASADPELNQHLTLWERLGEPETVQFTTSLESFSSERPQIGPFIELQNVDRGYLGWGSIYIPVGKGTDLMALMPTHPVAKPFTKDGKVRLESIFDLPDVVCHF